jgi:(4-(4-[2-(gamma-L-glutamylamino)ethyl]phenoxymethyl)furan-2-yl)methanamine synthase
MSAVLGLDVGGANLKAAYLPRGGAPMVVEQAFALWRDPARLPTVLRIMADELGPAERIALTLTAELADCFRSKAEGVASVVRAVTEAFPEAQVRVWGTDARFHPPAVAVGDPVRIAAANWLASATLSARDHPDAVLIDVGSTTTDVVPVVGGRVVAQGRTDPERLRSGELVYTGALRTPVCAVVRRVPLYGGWHRVAAEWFAITADVHRWLRHLAPEEYTCETPDGRGVGRDEVAARLARVVCADPDMLAPGDLGRIARHVHRAQRRQIAVGIRQVLRRLGTHAPDRFLALGAGHFLAADAAASVGLRPVSAERATPRYTPAAAVALLLVETLG